MTLVEHQGQSRGEPLLDARPAIDFLREGEPRQRPGRGAGQDRESEDEQGDERGGGRRALRPAQHAPDESYRFRRDRTVAAHRGEVFREVVGGVVAAVAFLRERGLHHDPEIPRHAAVPPAQVLRLFPEDLAIERVPRRREKGARAREHLVERDAESPHVDAAVEVGAGLDLLRGHVGRRAEGLAGMGERRGVRLDIARETEIQDHGLPLVRHHDVAGLDVAVDDPVLVRVVQGMRRLLDEFERGEDVGPRARDREGRRRSGLGIRRRRRGGGARDVEFEGRERRIIRGTRDQPLGEGRALDEAHDEVGDAVLDAGVIDRADPGVIEARGRLRFAPEALEHPRSRRGEAGHDLDRDVPPEPRVFGEIDGALSALPELTDEPVRPERRAHHGVARGLRTRVPLRGHAGI